MRKMMNVWSSINDPIFYMHHANLDRIWWMWQKRAEENLYSFGGPVYPFGRGPGTVTLNCTMEMGAFMAPSLPVLTVMDTVNADGRGFLCYEYETYPENPRA
jgi:tyrosinase